MERIASSVERALDAIRSTLDAEGERMGVADFRDLDVYQTAFATAMKIFELTKRFPSDEKYSMTQQVRRASRSVCSNIGEAWRKRLYEGAFVSKLSDADTEAGETQVWLDFAKACGYITPSVYDELRDRCDHVCRMLVRMMERPDLWCRDRRKRRGGGAEEP